MAAVSFDFNEPNHRLLSMLLVGKQKSSTVWRNQRRFILLFKNILVGDEETPLINLVDTSEMRNRLFASLYFQKMLERAGADPDNLAKILDTPQTDNLLVLLAKTVYQCAIGKL